MFYFLGYTCTDKSMRLLHGTSMRFSDPASPFQHQLNLIQRCRLNCLLGKAVKTTSLLTRRLRIMNTLIENLTLPHRADIRRYKETDFKKK